MKFEDLKAWQKARELTNAVYRLCAKKPLSVDFGLRDQIQRAAVSAMSNIAEGFERQGRQEKFHLYNIARASTGEVRSISYVILDNHLAPTHDVVAIQELSNEVSAIIYGLMRSTQNP